jgi:hypothetical protein
LWGAVGCGALVLLALIALAVSMPKFGKLVENIAAGPEKGQTLTTLHKALEKYRNEHKKAYPRTLDELVPKYLPDASLLEAQQMVYTPPTEKSRPEDPVVSIKTGENEILGQKQLYYVRLLQDGTIVQDQVTRTPLLNQPQ